MFEPRKIVVNLENASDDDVDVDMESDDDFDDSSQSSEENETWGFNESIVDSVVDDNEIKTQGSHTDTDQKNEDANDSIHEKPRQLSRKRRSDSSLHRSVGRPVISRVANEHVMDLDSLRSPGLSLDDTYSELNESIIDAPKFLPPLPPVPPTTMLPPPPPPPSAASHYPTSVTPNAIRNSSPNDLEPTFQAPQNPLLSEISSFKKGDLKSIGSPSSRKLK